MALTALQVEQSGSEEPKALAPGKHHDEQGLCRHNAASNARLNSQTAADNV
jgi:hypothetical protein